MSNDQNKSIEQQVLNLRRDKEFLEETSQILKEVLTELRSLLEEIGLPLND